MKIETIPVKRFGKLPLIIDEKTALVDCALAISDKEILAGLKKYLGERKLDYIFLTHSHFDHVGSISAIRKAYPDVKVVASEKTAYVFTRPDAIELMQHMTDVITEADNAPRCIIDTKGLYVDIVVKEGDVIDLGGSSFTVYETKGHTDCSISFFCESESILIACESIGVWYGKYPINLEICKSYKDVLNSIEKYRRLDPETLYVSHTGLFTDGSPREYFSMAEHGMIFYKNIVWSGFEAGKTDEEIILECREKIFERMLKNGINVGPYERWLTNTRPFVAFARKEFEQN